MKKIILFCFLVLSLSQQLLILWEMTSCRLKQSCILPPGNTFVCKTWHSSSACPVCISSHECQGVDWWVQPTWCHLPAAWSSSVPPSSLLAANSRPWDSWPLEDIIYRIKLITLKDFSSPHRQWRGKFPGVDSHLQSSILGWWTTPKIINDTS